MVLGLSLSLGLTLPTHCQAAKLSTYLTAKDLARPELLDQNGQQLTLDSSHHSHSALPSGSTPTYVAVPLYGGEHLPGGITTLVAGSQAGGTTVGPLDFDSTLKANLNAALAASASGVAVVDTPQQNYLVEYLPRYARSLSGSTTGTGSTTSAQTGGGSSSGTTTTATTPPQTDNGVRTWLATEAPGVGQTTTTATHSTKAASSSAANELSRLLTTADSTMTNWSAKSVAELEKVLNINSSKATATKPSLNLEAQVLGSSPPLPSPIPEPSTWLVFGLILGAAGLRQRLRRRVG
ncbi:MAG TPA: PEP-CTERM sorting domain-containing protein [Isosphaeraceae bacterium]|nr:PEP-CTERM sorting domain-containing protein [Isosphaeraceae bacterium]